MNLRNLKLNKFFLFIIIVLLYIHFFTTITIEKINYSALGWNLYFKQYFNIYFLFIGLITALLIERFISKKIIKSKFQLIIKNGSIELVEVDQLSSKSSITLNNQECEIFYYDSFQEKYYHLKNSRLLDIFFSSFEEKNTFLKTQLELELYRIHQKLIISYVNQKYRDLENRGIKHYKEIFSEDLQDISNEPELIERINKILSEAEKIEEETDL